MRIDTTHFFDTALPFLGPSKGLSLSKSFIFFSEAALSNPFSYTVHRHDFTHVKSEEFPTLEFVCMRFVQAVALFILGSQIYRGSRLSALVMGTLILSPKLVHRFHMIELSSLIAKKEIAVLKHAEQSWRSNPFKGSTILDQEKGEFSLVTSSEIGREEFVLALRDFLESGEFFERDTSKFTRELDQKLEELLKEAGEYRVAVLFKTKDGTYCHTAGTENTLLCKVMGFDDEVKESNQPKWINLTSQTFKLEMEDDKKHIQFLCCSRSLTEEEKPAILDFYTYNSYPHELKLFGCTKIVARLEDKKS